MTARGVVAIGTLAIAGGWVACGGEGGASARAPTPASQRDGSTDAVAGDASTDAPDATQDGVAPRRTVSMRDPFGDIAQTTNLLFDGDFEWSGGFVNQYPWLKEPSVGRSGPTILVSSQCRSGLRCAALNPYEGVMGFGVGKRGQDLYASLWSKPPSGDCNLITVSITGCQVDTTSISIPPSSPTPDADGWCKHEGIAAPFDDAPCMLVTSKVPSGQGVVILDDAVLVLSASQQGGAQVRSVSRSVLTPRHIQLGAALRRAAIEFMLPKPRTSQRPLPIHPKGRMVAP